MSLAGMTSAMLLVGAPVNIGGLSPVISAQIMATAADPKPIAAPVASSDSAAGSPPTPDQTTPQATDQDVMDVTVTTRTKTEGDPLERLNAVSFEVTQAVDKAVVGPVALSFVKIVPVPVRDGLNNFLFNVQEPKVFVNFLLQHKIGKAVETLGRFLINTTIGIGGLFDIAKRKGIRLPRRPNGFADTMGFYGVKPGAYLFLPIVGPTTVRDIFGSIADRALLPLAVGRPFNTVEFTLPTSVGRTLDRRAAFDEDLRRMREGAKDLYSARRDFYLQSRQDEIDDLRGRPHTPIRPSVRPSMPPSPDEPVASQKLIPAPAPGMPKP